MSSALNGDKDANPPTLKPESDDTASTEHYSPEEEASLLAESNTQKSSANTLFSRAAYSEAIQSYDKALSTCPNHLDYEIAVLRSNIAACHLKLQDWKAAIDAATASLECLDRVDPPSTQRGGQDGAGAVEEVDDETEARIEALRKSGRSSDDVQKLRTKALLRRAKARLETGGWAALQGADEDYRALSLLPTLTPPDRKTVERALKDLGPRLEEAKSREMGEMMAKLKQLGNGILKPFGLSTDNFQMVKDEKSGGYSMNFNQNR
ncbi:hypothetical protein B0A49_00946 [Cryomyces minteri]|uniref:Tetratricopeptide repeat protein 1 n=1 Tax=Cryomyces minteri TaxID=331657 RepID=A0A4U0XZ27_9PEZI|nr:hypothetical protein B0A49_00946 [Cryomyces minteri]